MRLVFCSLAILCAGCFNINRSFPCASDDQCASEQGQGVCVAENSRCAFTDDQCPSGLRFGELADALSGSCVGETTSEFDAAPNGVQFSAITAGDAHTCALTTTAQVYCWGDNSWGQLDANNSGPSLVPVLVPLPGTARSIAAGANHTCALFGSSDVVDGLYCWGDNRMGQLGTGDTNMGGVVLRGPDDPLTQVTRVSAGENHTCATSADGNLYCWGGNSKGQAGLGDVLALSRYANSLEAVDEYVALDLGTNHSCALRKQGDLYLARCFGDNSDGQLAIVGMNPVTTLTSTDFTFTTSNAPRRSLSAGGNTTCAINDLTEKLLCWGDNRSSQFGDPSVTVDFSETPSVVSVSGSPRSVVVGGQHVCAVSSSGLVQCWGNNGAGQVGTGAGSDEVSSSPMDLSIVVPQGNTLALGAQHSCAVVNGGVVRCWGDNGSGQLGVGDLQSRDVPTEVIP